MPVEIEDIPPDAQQSKLDTVLRTVQDAVVYARLAILVGIHLLCFTASYLLAFLLRFDFAPPESYVALFWQTLIWIAPVKLVVFYLSSNFNGWLRYVTFADLKGLFRAALLAE